jgi:hypothetical protein
MPSKSIYSQLRRHAKQTGAKAAQGEPDAPKIPRIRVEDYGDLNECAFKNSQCRGKHVVVKDCDLGTVRVCQFHKNLTLK